VARPCDCDGPCLRGRYGAYTVLVHLAQADTDPARRQQAMDLLAKIGPSAGSIGADGSCPGDQLAASMLARLYPDDPRPDPQPDPRAAIAAIEAEARARAEQIIAGHQAAAIAAVRADSTPAGG
jgi:hypothetical protein